MSVFNPQVQEVQVPNYGAGSRPIETPTPDKSAGMILDTLGKGIEGATKIVDTGIKQSIDKDIQSQVDVQRDAYTSALENVKAQAPTQTVVASNDGGTPGSTSWMDANASMDAPPSLEAGLNGVSTLGAARQAGKINDTYYTQQLNSISKNLRNQYPGYRDYIDQKISQVTGMDPANAYYKNLMEDINRQNALASQQGNKFEGYVMKNDDIPGNMEKYYMVKNKLLTENGYREWVNNIRSVKFNQDARKAAREENKGSQEDVATQATTDFSNLTGSYVQDAFKTTAVATGTNSIADTIKFFDKMAQNPEGMDPKLVQQYTTGLKVKRDNIYAYLKSQANVKDATGQTFTTRMGGPDKVDGIIKSQLSSMDNYIEAVNNKQWGVGTAIQRRVQAIGEESQRNLLEDKDIGQVMQTIQGMESISPNSQQFLIPKILTGNVDKRIGSYIEEKFNKAVGQSDNKQIRSFSKDVDDAQSKGLSVKSGAYTGLANISSVISDPRSSTQAKLNAALWAFNPENSGVLNKFKMDYTDPDTGKQVPGKYSLYGRFTSPDITRELVKLKGTSDGRIVWDNYKAWSEGEFTRLFRDDAATLTGLQENRAKITWDSDNNRFGLILPNGVPDTRYVSSLSQTNSVINRLNGALSNLSQIHKAEGGNTSAYLLRVLGQAGFNPSANMQGLPSEIRDAIIASGKKQSDDISKSFHRGE